jgi:hypothetical protein
MTTDETPRPSPERSRLSLDAPSLAIGLCVTIIGVALTLDRLQIISAAQILRFWPVGLILLGAAMVAQAFWSGGEAPAGGGHRRGVFRPFLFFWIMLAIVFGLGQRDRQAFVTRSGSGTGETVSLFSIMGRDNQINSASPFRGGEMTSVMGESVLDLREATIPPGEEAVIDVFTVMGGLVLRVPAEWKVEVQAVPVMGGIKDQRVGSAEAGTTTPPRLVVRGSLLMGGLTIKS